MLQPLLIHQQGTRMSTKARVWLERFPATNSVLWVLQWKFFPLKAPGSWSEQKRRLSESRHCKGTAFGLVVGQDAFR